MKVRKIEKRTANNSKWETINNKIYDNDGNILRDISVNGNLNEYIRDSEGKLLCVMQNGELIQQNYYNSGNISRLTYISGDVRRDEYYDHKTGKLLSVFENGKLLQKNVYDVVGRLKLEKYSNSFCKCDNKIYKERPFDCFNCRGMLFRLE